MGFGISDAFWCWLSEGVGPGSALSGRGVPARGGHPWEQSGMRWSCVVPGAGAQHSG